MGESPSEEQLKNSSAKKVFNFLREDRAQMTSDVTDIGEKFVSEGTCRNERLVADGGVHVRFEEACKRSTEVMAGVFCRKRDEGITESVGGL